MDNFGLCGAYGTSFQTNIRMSMNQTEEPGEIFHLPGSSVCL